MGSGPITNLDLALLLTQALGHKVPVMFPLFPLCHVHDPCKLHYQQPSAQACVFIDDMECVASRVADLEYSPGKK